MGREGGREGGRKGKKERERVHKCFSHSLRTRRDIHGGKPRKGGREGSREGSREEGRETKKEEKVRFFLKH